LRNRADRLIDDDLGRTREITPEVGDEGGSSGDVEVERNKARGAGSEARETWRPSRRRPEIIERDNEGRRSP